MKIFANEKEMYAFKRACADDGFGGVGRDLGISASTVHKIFKSGMDAEVRAVNIRNRVLEYITPYLSLADQKAKAQAELATAEKSSAVDELGMSLESAEYDNTEDTTVISLINQTMRKMNRCQRAEMYFYCQQIVARGARS